MAASAFEYTLHTYDIPDSVVFESSVAIDTEAMGLHLYRDRLCLVQLYHADIGAHLIHFPKPVFDKSPNLVKLLSDSKIQKLFHFARFDVKILEYSFNTRIRNLYCTKIASKLCRTYTDKHSLKDLTKELLCIELSKEEQTSDWGAPSLTQQQCNYALKDVIYLHPLQERLDSMLAREGRAALAQACFDFIPHRTTLDRLVHEEFDIFSHEA